MVKAALSGELNNSEFTPGAAFGLSIPKSVPGVPDEVLNPRVQWKDQKAFGAEAEKLVGLFKNNFENNFLKDFPELEAAGPVTDL